MYKYFEFNSKNNIASIYGFIGDKEDLVEYLSSQDYSEKDLKDIKLDGKVAVIQSFFVQEKYRNEGIGTELLDKVLDHINDEEAYDIFLICDNIQHNNFSLEKWYEDYGFCKIADKYDTPLMYK